MSIQQMFDPVMNEAVALEGLRKIILNPMKRDDMRNARGLLKTVRAAMKHGPSAVTVAALCLLSSDKLADDKLTDAAVLGIFKRSHHEHTDSIGNVCLGGKFVDWCAATGFDPAAIDVDEARQSVDSYNALEELWRLCVRGGAQSGICLLKSSWLQRQSDQARRLPSRNALPRDAVYSGPITQESVFIIALSYCWATREHPDPKNKLLADVCEVLKYLDTSRHFGDDQAAIRDTNIGEREVLVFWDYPCLYQKGDTSTNGITLLQRDSFDRGLDSINILYGHAGTLSLLCTKHYADPTTRMPYKDSAWPYFEMLVSTLIKPADKAVNLPVALEWIGAKASDIASGLPGDQSNCSLYWLYQHARRRERRLPVLPEQFNEDIKGKKATNGSDIQILINKFRQTFDAVMAPAQVLELSNVPGPNASEWHLFLTKTLRSCAALVHVNLCRNEAIAGVTLEVFSHLNGTLEYLFGPHQLCGLRGQSAATPTFPEIEVFVLAGVSVSRREPRAFEGPAGLGDLGRRSLLRSCRRPGAAFVSAEAPAPSTFATRRWHRRRSSMDGGGLWMRRCAQTVECSWWEGAASDATMRSGPLCGARPMTGRFR